jgi:hypothetical protein
MIPEIRNKFNADFTAERFEVFKQGLQDMYNHKPNFREAETPFFIPKILKERLLEACDGNHGFDPATRPEKNITGSTLR